MSELSEIWIILCALIVLDLQCGFLCLEAGTVRAKNAANVALKNLSDICVVVTVYWLAGFAIMFGASQAGLFGTSGFIPAIDNATGDLAALFFFQLAFAATAATIVSGAVAERERYVGYILFSAILAALVYPVVGHWVWAGGILSPDKGWLQAMGFLDFAGATVVHSVGGWSALVAICVVGPRLGRFSHHGRRFSESSAAMKALGAVFLWIGWGAFNGGSALVFGETVGAIIARTMIGAAGGGVAAIAVSMLLYRHPRIDTVINGVLAGLVAGTAGIDLYSAGDAFIVGVFGALVMAAATRALEALRIDDVVGAVPVHLAAGIWGTLAVALFAAPADLPAGGRMAQLGIQALGILSVGGWVVLILGPLAISLKRAGLFRASPKDEVRGLNLAENHLHDSLSQFVQEIIRHQWRGRIGQRLAFERASEVSTLAQGYNRILDRVEGEIDAQMSRLDQERELRILAEKSFAELRKVQEESAWAARHDALTGLGNRLFLDEMTADAEDDPARRTILCIAVDLDRFKDVNDSYGHEAGDRVLEVTAERLRGSLRQGHDFAFRIGGDEFVVLIDYEGRKISAQQICDRFVDTLSEPVPFGSAELRIGASIGFALSEPGEVAQDTRRRADLALYEAKAKGRNRAVAYATTMSAVHQQRLEMLEDFKLAFERGEFSVQLQPQVAAGSGALVGCEALARWDHPRRGRLTPEVFLPLAEELDMVDRLDRALLDLVLGTWRALLDAGVALPSLSVNVSAGRLSDPGLLDELDRLSPFPGILAFEILETAFLDSVTEELSDRIWELKKRGIRIEIDDFGTGHASFAGLLALHPDRIKIDRIFVRRIDQDEERRNLVKGLIKMAHNIGATVVIEGVETGREATALSSLGTDVFQGYYFGRPMSEADFTDWALSGKTRRGT